MKAIITRIQDSKIYAKSVNPLGEKPVSPYNGSYNGMSGGAVYGNRNYAERCYDYDLQKWQQAESERQELQLSEDDYLVDHVFYYVGGSRNSLIILEGDEINVIEQDGKFKII